GRQKEIKNTCTQHKEKQVRQPFKQTPVWQKSAAFTHQQGRDATPSIRHDSILDRPSFTSPLRNRTGGGWQLPKLDTIFSKKPCALTLYDNTLMDTQLTLRTGNENDGTLTYRPRS
ncbi:unnamed protein product, partial [Ectocarpus sp. 4 AP-2014]